METGENTAAGEGAVCGRCGATGAFIVAGEAICMDCYQGAGSCCAESEMEECEDEAGNQG